jgi:formate/nitrite transporter FocA (FNT family)
MSVEAFARRQLPLLASAFAGISMIVGYFFAPVAGQLQSDVNRFASPVIAAGFGIGYIGLMIQHIRRLVRMEKD